MEPLTIQSDIIYVDHKTPGWTLHRGIGKRVYRGSVEFAQPFDVIPQVVISFQDEDGEDIDIPAKCMVKKVNQQGFEYVFSTWASHKVKAVYARWVAMAQYKYPRGTK